MKTCHPARKALSILLIALMAPLSGFAESFLWKASSDQGTLYLQGSVHFLKASDYPLDPAIEEAYAASSVLVFETDLNRMESARIQQLLLEKAVLPDGTTLRDELNEEVYGMLAAELSRSGLQPEVCQRFKPWFTMMTLTLIRMQAMGLDPEKGLDQYFHRKADADGKMEVGLESVEYQIDLFDALSGENQNAYTRYALKELEQMETDLALMLDAWKTGNLEALHAMVTESFDQYPGMYQKFVTNRNKLWAETLDTLVSREHPCMVVVGAAHFAGKEGLLELLRARGYTIEQL